jgi:hypothetical protein
MQTADLIRLILDWPREAVCPVGSDTTLDKVMRWVPMIGRHFLPSEKAAFVARGGQTTVLHAGKKEVTMIAYERNCEQASLREEEDGAGLL